MKKMIKKIVACFLAAMVVWCTVSTVMAKTKTNCLDVRDYGYHRYNQRYYDTYSFAYQSSTGVYYSQIKDYGNGHYLSQARKDYTTVYDKYIHGICVCDAQKVVSVEESAKTVCRTDWYDKYMEVIDYYIVTYY